MYSISTSESRWWRQLRDDDPVVSAPAAFALSALLLQRGEQCAAEEVLRNTIDVRDPALAPTGMVRLARLLEQVGRTEEADEMYERTTEAASVEHCPEVVLDLAARWLARGHAADAATAYWELRIGAREPRLRALAAYRLGDLQRDAGLGDQAIASWRQALEEADESLVPHVMVALAEALTRPEMEQDEADQAEAVQSLVPPEGNREAEEMLERVMHADDPDLAPRAALNLGRLKRAGGELREAYRLFQLVIESEHPDHFLEAHAEQSSLLHLELDLFLGPAYESPPSPVFVHSGRVAEIRNINYDSLIDDILGSPMARSQEADRTEGVDLVRVLPGLIVDAPDRGWSRPAPAEKLENLEPGPLVSEPASAARKVSAWVSHMLAELETRQPEPAASELPPRSRPVSRSQPSPTLRWFVASTLTRRSCLVCPVFESGCEDVNRWDLWALHSARRRRPARPAPRIPGDFRIEVEVDHDRDLLLVLHGPSGARRLVRGGAADRILWHRVLDLLIFDSAGLLAQLWEEQADAVEDLAGFARHRFVPRSYRSLSFMRGGGAGSSEGRRPPSPRA
jgi:tetratricopeptide (TPR) repeat protein